jgi:hypothetical protein
VTRLPKADLPAALDAVVRRLSADRFFSSRKVGGKRALALLRELLDDPPASVEKLFGETLQGDAPAVRFAGVVLASSLFGSGKKVQRFPTKVRVARGKVKVVVGNAKIEGNLELPEQAMFVVTGNLVVDGNIVADEMDYTLVAVGGSLRVRNLISAGEVLVGKGLEIVESAYLHGNDYSAIAPTLRASLLVQNDREDFFGTLDVDRREDGFFTEENPRRFAKVASAVGLAGITTAEELESSLRKWWRTGKKPAIQPAKPPERKPKPADINAPNEHGWTRLHLALLEGDPIDSLLRAGADPNAPNNLERTALHLAAQSGGPVATLLKAGGDPNRRDQWHWTPLHLAAKSGDVAGMKALIDAGAELELRAGSWDENDGGETALWLACQRGHEPMVKLLLDAGADPNTKNDEGRTLADARKRS